MFPLGEVLILKWKILSPLDTAKARHSRYDTSRSFNEKSDNVAIQKIYECGGELVPGAQDRPIGDILRASGV